MGGLTVVIRSTGWNEAARRAINARVGRPGLATRAQIRTWCEVVIDATLESIMQDLTEEEFDD